MHRKAKKQSRRTVELREGCYCTEIKVTPANWEKAGASIQSDWQIWYRFYDPVFIDHPTYKKGKLVPIKGMNHVHTLAERRAITKALVRQEREQLELGWNPIRKKIMAGARAAEVVPEYIVAPDTPLIKALQASFDRITKLCPKCEGTKKVDGARCVKCDGRGLERCSPEMRINLKSVLKYFTLAAKAAMQHMRPIETVKRRHIVMIWEQLAIIKSKVWSDNLHNFYRSHLDMLFDELFDIETIEWVPLGSIKQKQVPKKIRETLTAEERTVIDKYLREHNYRFWRVLQIFFHSGARTTELLTVRKCDVDFIKMRVAYTVKKGKGGVKKLIYRPIKDIAYSWWKEVVSEAQFGEDYLFSDDLKPGNKTIRREQITRRWRLWIKIKLSDILEAQFGPESRITADWYSLRYSNTTEIVEQAGVSKAMEFTGHTTPRMINTIYDVRKEEREHANVRKSVNAFA